jgi:two-component system chemotaxis sensor kinase CheA
VRVVAWAFPFSEDELQVFLQETDEHLEQLEAGLLELERSGPSAELLAAIFRSAHTLKGAAGAVGHDAMTRLTHAMEEVLDGLRSGRLAFQRTMGDALLEAVDRLGQIRAAIASRAEGEVEVDATVAALQALSGGGSAPAPVGAARPSAAAASASRNGQADGDGAASDPEPRPQADGPADGERRDDGPRLRALVLLRADCPMPAVRAYQALQAARACGHVVGSRPTPAEIEGEKVRDRLELWVTSCQAAELTRVLQAVPDVAEVRVEADAPAAGASASPVRVQQTVRVDVTVLDNLMNLVGELVIGRTRLAQALGTLDGVREEDLRELTQVSSQLARITADLQDEVMRSRMLPVDNLFRKFPRLVRDAARQVGKEIEFVVSGEETELDRSVLEEIGDPLVHLLRNAVDHGIEPPEERRARGKPPRGTITLSAEHRQGRIVITVADDGAGIDADRVRATAVARGVLSEEAARRLSREEAIELIFLPGFTTKREATTLSGRGVGLDVVRRYLDRLGGEVRIDTAVGHGTRFTISLPLTLAIVRSLLVEVEGTVYALPLHSVVAAARVEPGDVWTIQGEEVVRLRGEVLPLFRGRRLLGSGGDAGDLAGRPVVHVLSGSHGVALAVDALLGDQEVVIKGLDRRLGAPPGIAGAAILGDGRVALILDPGALLKGVARVA